MSNTRTGYKRVDDLSTPLLEINQPDTIVRDGESLYQALERKGLLFRSNVALGIHLIEHGRIGMSIYNGKPFFLSPGQHTLWSGFHHYMGDASISDKIIRHGDKVTIVTIDQGELGLSTIPGKNIILEPGQHILLAPQKYIKSALVNTNYVVLGTHHRISVPVGSIAIAYNEGKKIILSPTPLKVDDEHCKHLIVTNDEVYTIDSATFRFDPNTGFKSVQMEDMQLKELTVNTREMISLKVVGSVRYQIVDPVRAFLMTEDVVADIQEQARAVLTSVFSKLSIDEVASSLASIGVHTKRSDDKCKDDVTEDMLHHATKLFMEEFSIIVRKWGVEANLINITSMQLMNETFRNALQKRAEQTLNAQAQLSTVEQETKVMLATAQREADKKVIEARAEAERIRMLADAKVYAAQKDAEAARMLESTPLAAQLRVMTAQKEIAEALGDKTVVINDGGNNGFNLGGFSLRSAPSNMLLFNNRQGASGPGFSLSNLPVETKEVSNNM